MATTDLNQIISCLHDSTCNSRLDREFLYKCFVNPLQGVERKHITINYETRELLLRALEKLTSNFEVQITHDSITCRGYTITLRVQAFCYVTNFDYIDYDPNTSSVCYCMTREAVIDRDLREFREKRCVIKGEILGALTSSKPDIRKDILISYLSKGWSIYDRFTGKPMQFLPAIKGEQLTLRNLRVKEELVLKFQIGAKSIQLPLPENVDEDALFSAIEKIIHTLI